MGFFRTLSGIFGGNRTTAGRERSFGADAPRTPSPPDDRYRQPTEYDEIRESEAAIAEDRANRVIDEWSIEDRLMAGEVIDTPESSNVAWYKYLLDNEELQIGYRDGSVYGYYQIDRAMAVRMIEAGSKGGFVWDELRVRGTVFGFKKPYVYYSGPSGNNRKWYRAGEKARLHHGQVPPAGEPYRGWHPTHGSPLVKGGLGKKRGKGKKK